MAGPASPPPPPYSSLTRAEPSRIAAASLAETTVSLRGRHFVDQHGRIVNLRGLNVSGASKLPSSAPSAPLSFIDRPFPLSSARYHFSRLLSWGHPYIRLLVTWEALAHKGPHPSQLDEDYIAYIYELLTIAGEIGLKVTVCAHQDVWSRWSGGSGAPRWTFEMAGMNVNNFGPCASAWVGNRDASEGKRSAEDEKVAGDFVWPSGYQKLAAATMATLFWAGDTFAGKKRVTPPAPTEGAAKAFPDAFPAGPDGLISIQQLLQASYLAAYGRLADILSPLPALIGFEVQNEPHRGYIELYSWDAWDYNTDLHIGLVPTLRQSLALGEGYSQPVNVWEKSWPFPTRKTGVRQVDPKGVSVWTTKEDSSERASCLWRSQGVWEWDKESSKAKILRQDYFTNDPRPSEVVNEGTLAQTKPGDKVEWYRDCYAPFAKRFAARMRRSNPGLQINFGPIPNEFFPPYLPLSHLSTLNRDQLAALRTAALSQTYASKTNISSTPNPRPENTVFAPHFYDLNVLFSKLFDMKWKMSVDVQSLSRGGFLPFSVYFGVAGLRKNYCKQIAKLVDCARLSLGEVPIVIGEIGVPFDLSVSGLKKGDSKWAAQEVILDALAVAMEASNIAGWTWWNYNPDNSRQARGDGWNGEDFSVVTQDEQPADGQAEKGASSTSLVSQGDDASMYAGGRALSALIRPYIVKLAGVPISSSFNSQTKHFEVAFAESRTFREVHGGLLGEEKEIAPGEWTEIFVPGLHYGSIQAEVEIEISDGRVLVDLERQSLFYLPSQTQLLPGTIHTISIRPTSNSPFFSSSSSSLGSSLASLPSRIFHSLFVSESNLSVVLSLIAVAVVGVACLVMMDSLVSQGTEGMAGRGVQRIRGLMG